MRYAACFLLFVCAAAQRQYGPYSDAPDENPTGAFVTVTVTGDVYTIPVFNPSNALTYGASKTTIYRPPAETTESGKSSHSTSSHKSASSTFASTRGSSSTGASTLQTSVSPPSDAPVSVPPAPAEQTGGAASRMHSCGAGAVAGSVLAGIALI